MNGRVYSQGSLFKPDTSFDPQWRKTPEQNLMFAVLDDAVSCFQKYFAARDEIGTFLFHEAEEWILQQGKSNWLYSFDNICETLDLNPGYIREGLLHWRDHRLRERHGVRLRMNKSRYASRQPESHKFSKRRSNTRAAVFISNSS